MKVSYREVKKAIMLCRPRPDVDRLDADTAHWLRQIKAADYIEAKIVAADWGGRWLEVSPKMEKVTNIGYGLALIDWTNAISSWVQSTTWENGMNRSERVDLYEKVVEAINSI